MFRRESIIFALCAWLLFLGFYLLMAGKTDGSELAAGAFAATVTLFLVSMLRERFKKPLRIKPRWLWLLWRVPVAMLTETWQLLAALCRALAGKHVEGELIEYPFHGPDDRHESARRAVMTFGVCITPNSYLVYVDREQKRVLIRQLVGKELSKIDRLFVELP